MVIRPVDGFKAIHRRRVRQSKQMSLATNTRASCSPSQSKCCQKPRAASAKCRVFPVYLIIFSPKKKDVSVSLQCSHQSFSITPDPEQREESRVFLVPSDYLYLMEKDAASVFSQNTNQKEKPAKQSSYLQVKNSFHRKKCCDWTRGWLPISTSKFLSYKVFLQIVQLYLRKGRFSFFTQQSTKPKSKQRPSCCD